jgi:putative transposase
MVKILREADKAPVAEVAKKYGVSDVTIYAWRKRFGQLEAVDVKRLRELEHENGRLKKVLAERVMDIEILKEVAAKKGERARASPADRLRLSTRSIAATSVRAAERGPVHSTVRVPTCSP